MGDPTAYRSRSEDRRKRTRCRGRREGKKKNRWKKKLLRGKGFSGPPQILVGRKGDEEAPMDHAIKKYRGPKWKSVSRGPCLQCYPEARLSGERKRRTILKSLSQVPLYSMAQPTPSIDDRMRKEFRTDPEQNLLRAGVAMGKRPGFPVKVNTNASQVEIEGPPTRGAHQ